MDNDIKNHNCSREGERGAKVYDNRFDRLGGRANLARQIVEVQIHQLSERKAPLRIELDAKSPIVDLKPSREDLAGRAP